MNKPVSKVLRHIAMALAATVALGAAVVHAQDAPRAGATAAPVRGYLVANYTINDQEGFRKYMEAAGPLAPRYSGKVIIFDVKSRTLEGHPKAVMAVAEFPSVADAERFYNSPEYVVARQLRIASTSGSVVLAEGLPQSQ